MEIGAAAAWGVTMYSANSLHDEADAVTVVVRHVRVVTGIQMALADLRR
jgi:hypothetical protein